MKTDFLQELWFYRLMFYISLGCILAFLAGCQTTYDGNLATICGPAGTETLSSRCLGIRTWNQIPQGGSDEKSNSSPTDSPT